MNVMKENTNYVNKKMIRVSYFSDFTVFVSTWISNLYKNQGIKSINTGVILSGSDTEIFNNINKESWNKLQS